MFAAGAAGARPAALLLMNVFRFAERFLYFDIHLMHFDVVRFCTRTAVQ